MEFMQMNLHPSGSLVAAGFPGLYYHPGNLASPTHGRKQSSCSLAQLAPL